MHFEGSVPIKASREKVWAFVIDPQQVGECGPGVEKIDVIDATHFKATAKVGELLAQAAPAQAVAGRRERHGISVIHRVIGHGRRDLAGHRQDEVEVLDLRDHDIAGAGRTAVDGGHGGALRHTRRGLPRDGVRGPHSEDDEGHENGQRDRTPAPDLIAAADLRAPPLTCRASVHVPLNLQRRPRGRKPGRWRGRQPSVLPEQAKEPAPQSSASAIRGRYHD